MRVLNLWLRIALEWLHECCMGYVVGRAVVLSFFSCRTVTVPWSCFGCVSVCVVLCVFWSCGCRSHWNGCLNVAWAMLWGGSRSTKPRVFPCKVAAAGDESYLVCAAGAAAVGLSFFLAALRPHCNCALKLLWVCFCLRSSMRVLNLWLRLVPRLHAEYIVFCSWRS